MTEYTQLGAWQVAGWYLVACVATAAAWVTFGGQHRRMIADRQIAWLCWHWFTGGILEASRTYPGLDDEAPPAARAARRAGLAAARSSGTVAAGAVWYVNAGAPYGTAACTVLAAGVGAAATVAAVTILVAHAACELAHYLCWIRPLHLAVHDVLGWEKEKRPGSYLTVPRDRANSEDGVVVGFPPWFDLKKEHREAVENLVLRKLDLGEVVTTWVAAGRHQYVMFRIKDPMPERCYYRDPAMKALVAAAKPSAPVIGITRGGKPVTCDLDTESPHFLLSMGTGAGKSSVLRSVAAQLMARGALVMCIDIKRRSHQWLKDIPGVHIARDIDEIHHVLVQLADEGDKRNRAWDDVGIDDPEPYVGPRIVLLCEEMTTTTKNLRRHWKTIRESGEPTTSPAVDALEDIACMGRQASIHLLAVAQMATVKSMGGSEIRENFGYRFMARYTKKAWEMLVPECAFTAAKKLAGWMMVCIGGQAIETQGLYMTDHEARELAMSRATAPQRHSLPVSQGQHPVAATAPVDGELVAPPPTVDLVSLRQAVEGGLILITLSNLRSCRARDPEFPAPFLKDGQTDLYEKDRLVRWARNRPRELETTNV